jgi:hypothetical protein
VELRANTSVSTFRPQRSNPYCYDARPAVAWLRDGTGPPVHRLEESSEHDKTARIPALCPAETSLEVKGKKHAKDTRRLGLVLSREGHRRSETPWPSHTSRDALKVRGGTLRKERTSDLECPGSVAMSRARRISVAESNTAGLCGAVQQRVDAPTYCEHGCHESTGHRASHRATAMLYNGRRWRTTPAILGQLFSVRVRSPDGTRST